MIVLPGIFIQCNLFEMSVILSLLVVVGFNMIHIAGEDMSGAVSKELLSFTKDFDSLHGHIIPLVLITGELILNRLPMGLCHFVYIWGICAWYFVQTENAWIDR